MTWQPWIDFKGELGPIDVAAPPCAGCAFWKPRVETKINQRTATEEFFGVRLCVSDDMYQDFSCFRERE